MTTVIAPAEARETTLEVTIIRANGTVEHLGTLSYWHRNPLKRLFWRLKKFWGDA